MSAMMSFDIGDRGGGGIEPVERPVGLLGDDVGYGGLARPRGAVEDQVGDIAPLHNAAEQTVFPKMCPCPTTSSSVLGRIRAASGDSFSILVLTHIFK